VQIHVNDVNEFPPTWPDQKDGDPLKVVVHEGADAADVANVRAVDADGSDHAGRVCSYTLENNEDQTQPFEVNDNGMNIITLPPS